MSLVKEFTQSIEKRDSLIMLAIPPQLYMGGQYMVLLYTVAKLTHFIMPEKVDLKIQILKIFLSNEMILPKATRGPQ